MKLPQLHDVGVAHDADVERFVVAGDARAEPKVRGEWHHRIVREHAVADAVQRNQRAGDVRADEVDGALRHAVHPRERVVCRWNVLEELGQRVERIRLVARL